MQFKDLLLTVSTNLKAGYSVENAFKESYRDLQMLYGAESPICREVKHIITGLENNVVLEKLLYSLGQRSHEPDIMQFAECEQLTAHANSIRVRFED